MRQSPLLAGLLLHSEMGATFRGNSRGARARLSASPRLRVKIHRLVGSGFAELRERFLNTPLT